MDQQKKGVFDSFTLKMIAIITMVIDHVGYMMIDSSTATYDVFRGIGRVAFPIFCFLIVEGFHHTRSHVNYLIRLCIFAILSEIPFDLAFHGQLFYWGKQNVFITLALGLAAIFCLEEMNNRKVYVIPLVLIYAAAYFAHCDYGLGGVLLITIFYETRKMPLAKIILVGLLLYLFYGPWEMYGLIALPFILLYNGKRGMDMKMFFYWFYPLHLLVLYFISMKI